MAAMPDSFIAGKRQFWREFLKLYQQMPELWEVNHADYRNKELRNESYEILQNKLREIQPNATKSDVGRRINIFRTNYRREQMRIWKQHELGLHSDLCKPTLWFYDNMSFLLSQESFQHRSKRMRGRPSLRGRSSMKGLSKDVKLDQLNTATTITALPPATTGSTTMPANDSSEASVSVLNESFLISPKIEIFDNELPEIDAERTEIKVDNADTSASEFNEPSGSNNSTTNGTIVTAINGAAYQQSTPMLSESSEAIAKSWAIQYEEMAPTQRIFARKAIADILFDGCMGNLRINRIKVRSSNGNQS
ncbi:uncharacterized protein LOC6557032 isoform X2 [Drosophila grimshawi]|uniref:uncharacterized protein LOC6557032 isoform X2 n=1 Tax=Drosophila grimshawi TaxID=7222 RepID=UPI000C86F759|nr:uncharacterized protein LOC6557032 isoform X2 [Drosophila grimshawi]